MRSTSMHSVTQLIGFVGYRISHGHT